MKKSKGFTLVELIIVMAILTILMAAIMQMFKPIRETYVDATLYESQRTAQNGIITYIGESVRYAVDMGIYQENIDSITDIDSAIDKFVDAYTNKYGSDPDDVRDNVQVIVIDNKDTHTFNGSWKGRVLRRKADGTIRVAMGEAYYGENNYDIVLSDGIGADPWKPENGIKITVSTLMNRDKSVTVDNMNIVSVNGEIYCRNLFSADHGVANPGMYDPHTSPSTPTYGTGENVYIVYLNGENKSNIP